MQNKSLYNYCNVIGSTDVGCVRKNNEDSLDSFECDNGLVSVVCDGMGGHVGGQIASKIAVETIRNFLCSQFFENPREAIIKACNEANQAILRRAQQQPELTGMGSTCVMVIVRNAQVYVGSIGDSRVYLIRSRKIHQLTKDQSYVQMLVDMGQITSEQAYSHPRKNEITNALGLPNMQPAVVLDTPIDPEAGDSFLLCSDGLTDMVPDSEIVKTFGDLAGMSQQDRVNDLISRARKHGGLDNITCQIVEFSITPSQKDKDNTNNVRIIKKYILPIFLCIVILGLGIFLGLKFGKNNNENVLASVVDTLGVKDNVKIINPHATLVNDSKNPALLIRIGEKGICEMIVPGDAKTKKFFSTKTEDSVSIKSIKFKPEEDIDVYVSDKEEALNIYLKNGYKEDNLSVIFDLNSKKVIYKYKVDKKQNIKNQDNVNNPVSDDPIPSDNVGRVKNKDVGTVRDMFGFLRRNHEKTERPKETVSNAITQSKEEACVAVPDGCDVTIIKLIPKSGEHKQMFGDGRKTIIHTFYVPYFKQPEPSDWYSLEKNGHNTIIKINSDNITNTKSIKVPYDKKKLLIISFKKGNKIS